MYLILAEVGQATERRHPLSSRARFDRAAGHQA
jgi:hypothetical protein